MCLVLICQSNENDCSLCSRDLLLHKCHGMSSNASCRRGQLYKTLDQPTEPHGTMFPQGNVRRHPTMSRRNCAGGLWSWWWVVRVWRTKQQKELNNGRVLPGQKASPIRGPSADRELHSVTVLFFKRASLPCHTWFVSLLYLMYFFLYRFSCCYLTRK